MCDVFVVCDVSVLIGWLVESKTLLNVRDLVFVCVGVLVIVVKRISVKCVCTCVCVCVVMKTK